MNNPDIILYYIGAYEVAWDYCLENNIAMPGEHPGAVDLIPCHSMRDSHLAKSYGKYFSSVLYGSLSRVMDTIKSSSGILDHSYSDK